MLLLVSMVWASPWSTDLAALDPVFRREGLRWGGAWRGQPSVWDAYGLGWDPAHVEVAGCYR